MPALLFSASLGCLGVLGDMHFHWFLGALTRCVPRTEEGLIAEDAEAAEARRKDKNLNLPQGMSALIPWKVKGHGPALGRRLGR
jgi:hypothetical protein